MMVYQVDVIKVCHHYAGLDLADADVLRRAMSGKYRSPAEMDRIREHFFPGHRNLDGMHKLLLKYGDKFPALPDIALVRHIPRVSLWKVIRHCKSLLMSWLKNFYLYCVIQDYCFWLFLNLVLDSI